MYNTARERDYVLDTSDAVRALVSGFNESVELEDGSRKRGTLPGLIQLLVEDMSEASPTGGGAKEWESKVPYHSPSFECLANITAKARYLARVAGAPMRDDTGEMLRGIVGVIGEATPGVQRQVADDLDALVVSARLVLGLDKAPIALRGVLCPYCSRPSIMAARNESRVWCVTGGCVDPEGRRWEWSGETQMRLLGESQAVPAGDYQR